MQISLSSERIERCYYLNYKDTGIHWFRQVPISWEVKRLKNALTRNEGGVWGSDSDRDDEGIIILRSTDIELNGKWNITNPARRKLSFSEFYAGKLLMGDLLVTKSSGSEFHLGKTAIVTQEVDELNCCFSNFMQRLRVNTKYSPKYIFWILNSSIGREQLNYFGSTTTGLNNLTGTLIGKLIIPVPSFAEQRAIADFLDRETARIDALIAKYQRLIELLEEKRTSLISQAVTKGLDASVEMKDSGVEWLGKIPFHWEISILGAKAIIKARLGWKGLKASEYVDSGYTFLSTPNIKNREINFENANYISAERYFESPEIMLQIGDVLLVKDGSTLGITNIVRKLPAPATVNSSIAVIRPNQEIDSVYLDYFLKGAFTQNNIQLMKDGMGVPHLFQADIRKFTILLPPLEEQKIIATFLNKETKEIDEIQKNISLIIESLHEFRVSIISSAVTGKIDVRK
jgi:type I restriction enzyme S subunit